MKYKIFLHATNGTKAGWFQPHTGQRTNEYIYCRCDDENHPSVKAQSLLETISIILNLKRLSYTFTVHPPLVVDMTTNEFYQVIENKPIVVKDNNNLLGSATELGNILARFIQRTLAYSSTYEIDHMASEAMDLVRKLKGPVATSSLIDDPDVSKSIENATTQLREIENSPEGRCESYYTTSVTMRCMLVKGHRGQHRSLEGKPSGDVTWIDPVLVSDKLADKPVLIRANYKGSISGITAYRDAEELTDPDYYILHSDTKGWRGFYGVVVRSNGIWSLKDQPSWMLKIPQPNFDLISLEAEIINLAVEYMGKPTSICESRYKGIYECLRYKDHIGPHKNRNGTIWE